MKKDDNIFKEGIFPIRIPQASNFIYWLIGTILLYLLWTGIFLRVLDFFNLVSLMRTGRTSAPNIFTVIMFLGFSYVGYLWRYTLPKSIYKYQNDKNNKPFLKCFSQIIFSIFTVILFLIFFVINWLLLT